MKFFWEDVRSVWWIIILAFILLLISEQVKAQETMPGEVIVRCRTGADDEPRYRLTDAFGRELTEEVRGEGMKLPCEEGKVPADYVGAYMKADFLKRFTWR